MYFRYIADECQDCRLTILRAATHETERGDHDSCLSRLHYIGTDPTSREWVVTSPDQESRALPTELPRPPLMVSKSVVVLSFFILSDKPIHDIYIFSFNKTLYFHFFIYFLLTNSINFDPGCNLNIHTYTTTLKVYLPYSTTTSFVVNKESSISSYSYGAR